MLEPTERTHDPECLAPRCPECGSTGAQMYSTLIYLRCVECQLIAHYSHFEATDCICADLAAARAEARAD